MGYSKYKYAVRRAPLKLGCTGVYIIFFYFNSREMIVGNIAVYCKGVVK